MVLEKSKATGVLKEMATFCEVSHASAFTDKKVYFGGAVIHFANHHNIHWLITAIPVLPEW